MQTYAQRALQARIHDVSQYMASTTNSIGTDTQYEPYYMQSNYEVSTNSVENKRLGQGLIGQDSTSDRTRSGYQNATYNGIMNGDV